MAANPDKFQVILMGLEKGQNLNIDSTIKLIRRI